MMKQYRKQGYLKNDIILRDLEIYYKRPLRISEEEKVVRNLKIIDYFLENNTKTNEELAEIFSISSSSIGRYLNNEVLLKRYYIEEAEKQIRKSFQQNRIEGNRKSRQYISDKEILQCVKAYLKDYASLTSVAKELEISKSAVYRRLTCLRIKELLTKETFLLLNSKLENQSLPKKHLEKQKLFVETKEEGHPMEHNIPLLAKRAEVQNRTAKKSLETPRMSNEEATRYRIEKQVENLADRFLLSKESFANTCKKYDCTFSEVAELFYNILSNSNFAKYEVLVVKYPYLKEYEEKKIFHSNILK